MLLTAFLGVTAVPLHNAETAAAAAAGLVCAGITAAQLARSSVPVYGVTWNKDVITSDAVGGTDNINRI